MQPGRSKCDKGSDDEGRQNVLKVYKSRLLPCIIMQLDKTRKW